MLIKCKQTNYIYWASVVNSFITVQNIKDPFADYTSISLQDLMTNYILINKNI